jgi:hypothetical protein
MKSSLCLIKRHAMKTCGGVEDQFQALLTSPLEGDECQLHVPANLPQGKKAPVLIGSKLGGPQSRFERCEEEKNLYSRQHRIPVL